MASNEPLLAVQPSKNNRTNMSIMYGTDSYTALIASKVDADEDMKALLEAQPDQQAKDVATDAGTKRTTAVHVEADGKSKKGKREPPVPNKPEPMPQELAFLFTKISPEQMMYMWNIYTLLFVAQCSSVLVYCGMLAAGLDWYVATTIFFVPFAMLMIQNVYILHDVLHGATFPPYEWQNFITHPWADLVSLPWGELILEHQRHHASTVDLLIHGEFGWDPAGWLYVLQEWTEEWYGWLTVPLVPVWHFIGANDTGALFAALWYCNYPDSGTGGKCHKQFFSKFVPGRLKHQAFVTFIWTCVWLLGTYPLGRPLREGWRFLLPVTIAARTGFAIAWTVFTNFNHSHLWNEFLAKDPERSFPLLHAGMALILGGKHRFNEMLFHDLHHAFPSAVGALSQRGRFHGWKKVHDAAVQVLAQGLWKKPECEKDQEPPMQKIQRKRSLVMQTSRSEKEETSEKA